MADNSLPKNIYVNGRIVNDKVLPVTDFFNQHVYKLSRDHNKEKFILIELSSCLGEVDFYIGELEIMWQYKNATKHDYRRIDVTERV
jgi:hypothetical protein